jgi:hypothetical protein
MADIQHDPEVAPPSETIHIPDPTYLPVALALFITITLVGIITWLPVLIIGAIGVIVILWRWIKDARAEFNELPLHHN